MELFNMTELQIQLVMRDNYTFKQIRAGGMRTVVRMSGAACTGRHLRLSFYPIVSKKKEFRGFRRVLGCFLLHDAWDVFFR